MNNHEMSQLLSYIAELDGRQITPTTVQVWSDVLGKDYSLTEMREAVRQHFTESTEFLKPGHLVAQVRRVRRERLNRVVAREVQVNALDDPRGPNATAAEFDQYSANRRAVSEAIATGRISRGQYNDYLSGSTPWAEYCSSVLGVIEA